MSIELVDLRKHFGAVGALNGISLSVADGEFLALLGPSGSGKTTLLRVLAGLDFVESGRILIGGRDMAEVPARHRRIGLVFQHYALFRHMTVSRNVAFGLEVRPRRTRPAAAEIRRRVQDLLDMLGIGELGGRYPDQISGGQRQRVALARALAIEPDLLLLDEPFGALDAKVRKSLRIWLRDLHDRIGLTSIFVTHDQAEALEMADRVAVMRAGRIEQVDQPETLYNEPATAFVHEFLGESLRFECRVAGGRVLFDDNRLPELAAVAPDGPAIALIRPHEVALVPQGTSQGTVRVEGVHMHGPMVHVRLGLAGQSIEILRPPTAWVPPVGAQCGVDLGAARIYTLSAGGTAVPATRPATMTFHTRALDVISERP